MLRFFPKTNCLLDSLTALVTDLIGGGLFRLTLRTRANLTAEILFLRKNLVFYEEPHVHPRRLSDAARFSLVFWSRLSDWKRGFGDRQTRNSDWLAWQVLQALRAVEISGRPATATREPHLSLGPRIPEPSEMVLLPRSHGRHFPAKDCKVAARAVLGSLHHEYRWERIAA
jgi:hypothetical protein